MLTDQELMEIHVRALFSHDGRDQLLLVNEPGGTAPAPRLFLGRTRAGNVWRFRADLPKALVDELEALCADEPVVDDLRGLPRRAGEYTRLLDAHAPARVVEAGPAYRFAEYFEPSRPLVAVTEANAEVLRGGFEGFVTELPDWQPFVALVEDGRAVSICRSVRVTAAAHEAGVETLPDFRGRGYAKEVVAGWASLVKALGAAPLYSTSWENHASQQVAKKLRLATYSADFQIT